MSDKQTFVLGIGAQKAGTTWLYDYLNSNDAVTFVRPKELHIFDAMLRPDLHAEFWLKAKIRHLSRSRKDKLKALLGRQPRGFVQPQQRMEMIGNPQAYVDYFRGLDPSAQAVGEITPSYATLNAAHFGFIRELLEPHFDLRVILLLRDPVQRAFSAAKHLMRVYGHDYPVALGVDANAYFESILTSSYILERQDYRRVLETLDEVFGPGTFHVEFYERLFTPEAVRSITDFLALPAKEADFGKRLNVGPKASSLDPQLAARARDLYGDTYDYCEDRFGKAVIDEIWMGAGKT